MRTEYGNEQVVEKKTVVSDTLFMHWETQRAPPVLPPANASCTLSNAGYGSVISLCTYFSALNKETSGMGPKRRIVLE